MLFLLVGCASRPPGLYEISRTKEIFAERDTQPLDMAIARPVRSVRTRTNTPPQARPMVLLLHGGAFNFGSRHQFDSIIDQLARHGFVAAAASYRLAPAHPFPAACQDAFAALRYLRQSAERLGGDPRRIAVGGASAGSNIAMTVGYCRTPDETFADCGPDEVATDVQAVINIYGPADLRYRFSEAGPWIRPLVLNYMTCKRDECPEKWAQASPVTFVGDNPPPTLSIHGTKDRVVAFEQTQVLDDALAPRGGVHWIVPLDAGHAYGYKSGSAESVQLASLIATFLQENMP